MSWKITSDPDHTHEKLLNVARIGARGDFTMAVGTAATVPEGGGTTVFPVTVARSTTSFERIVLSAEALPAGMSATFSAPSLYGFDGVSATMSVTVPSGTVEGVYQFKVVGKEHGNTHFTIASVVVNNDPPVASPPTVDASARGVIGATTVPARVVWPAAVDASAIAGYEIQGSVDGGAWGASSCRKRRASGRR